MKQALLMPKLGLTMTEGFLAEWSVKPGQAFKAGDCLFVVETDKVATEVPADADGELSAILVEAGNTVPVGELLGHWTGNGTNKAPTLAPKADARFTIETDEKPTALTSKTQIAKPAENGARIYATPLARRIAAELKVDLGGLRGTGPRGRIKAADVRETTQGAVAAPVLVAATQTSVGAAHTQSHAQSHTRSQSGSVQAAMARRLTEAKQQVPHFYLAVDVKVDALLALRRQLNDIAEQSGATRLTLNHFVVAAVGRALADLPQFNRVWSNGEILAFDRADVGVAVNTDRGLFVPIVRSAGNISLESLAQQAGALVESARAGKLGVADMEGGAVTVSNAGMFQVRYMTPIINPGQAMILGVGAINEIFRPDHEGKPALVREMGLVLAADHRILDGVSGLSFLNQVTSYLAQPLRLLVGSK